MINTGRRPCNYDRLDSSSTWDSWRGPRGGDTFPSDGFVCSGFLDECSSLPSLLEACRSLPPGIVWGSVFTCSTKCCLWCVTLLHLGSQPAQQRQHAPSRCVWVCFFILFVWFLNKICFHSRVDWTSDSWLMHLWLLYTYSWWAYVWMSTSGSKVEARWCKRSSPASALGCSALLKPDGDTVLRFTLKGVKAEMDWNVGENKLKQLLIPRGMKTRNSDFPNYPMADVISSLRLKEDLKWP